MVFSDLVISHPGWGEIYFIKDIWPEAKLLSYLNFTIVLKDQMLVLIQMNLIHLNWIIIFISV